MRLAVGPIEDSSLLGLLAGGYIRDQRVDKTTLACETFSLRSIATIPRLLFAPCHACGGVKDYLSITKRKSRILRAKVWDPYTFDWFRHLRDPPELRKSI